MFKRELKKALEKFKEGHSQSSDYNEAVRTMQYSFIAPVYDMMRKRNITPPYFKAFSYDAQNDKWYVEFLTIPEKIEFKPLRYKAKYIVENIQTQREKNI